MEAASSQALANLEVDDERLMFSSGDIEYVGVIASLTSNALVLKDGITFEIGDETEVQRSLSTSVEVIVDARISGDSLVALEIAKADPDEGDQTNLDPRILQRLSTGGFVIGVKGPDGTEWDRLGDQSIRPLPFPDEPGFITLSEENSNSWRLYNRELVSADGGFIGWLQTAQSLDPVATALGSVRTQLIWGVPIVVVLAALGGLFLADRGLRPIHSFTRTAQSIGSNVLDRRINYRGANDEVGRLAETFDAMLDRIEGAFERERRFTADASHELRTPLTSLKGRIDVTLSSPRSRQEYQETLRGLDEGVERLIRLTNELLFLARLDQRQVSSPPEEVDLSNLLSAVVEQIRPLAEARDLTLTEEVPSGILAPGNPDHLIRLFLNLVDNASKYTRPGGRVTVQAESNTTQASVRISDTGPGIPKEHLEHLFERFYRVDEARSRDSGGTGLGLAISYEIARLHKGTLGVQREVSTGTTFTVTIPAGP